MDVLPVLVESFMGLIVIRMPGDLFRDCFLPLGPSFCGEIGEIENFPPLFVEFLVVGFGDTSDIDLDGDGFVICFEVF